MKEEKKFSWITDAQGYPIGEAGTWASLPVWNLREVLAGDGDAGVTYIESITEVMAVDFIIQGNVHSFLCRD